MLQLHRERSRSYPGRSVRHASTICGSVLFGNIQGDWAEVSRGHSRRWVNEPGTPGKPHPAEGLNTEKGKEPL